LRAGANGKTLFWIAGGGFARQMARYRKGDIGFHHYAFELANRKAVDRPRRVPGRERYEGRRSARRYNGDDQYYAVFFNDPDGMRLEAMVTARRRNRP